MNIGRITLILLVLVLSVCNALGTVYIESKTIYLSGKLILLKTIHFLLNDSGLANLLESLYTYSKNPCIVIFKNKIVPVEITEIGLKPIKYIEQLPDIINIEDIDGFVISELKTSQTISNFVYNLIYRKNIILMILWLLFIIMQLQSVYNEQLSK